MSPRDKAPRRTVLQIEANDLDMQLYRLRQRMDEFAKLVNSSGIAMDAMCVGRARQLVRHHMHPRDREATS